MEFDGPDMKASVTYDAWRGSERACVFSFSSSDEHPVPIIVHDPDWFGVPVTFEIADADGSPWTWDIERAAWVAEHPGDWSMWECEPGRMPRRVAVGD